MRVDRIEAIPLAYTEPNDNGSTRHLLLTRVTTDTGHVGWGEAVTMIEARLSPLAEEASRRYRQRLQHGLHPGL